MKKYGLTKSHNISTAISQANDFIIMTFITYTVADTQATILLICCRTLGTCLSWLRSKGVSVELLHMFQQTTLEPNILVGSSRDPSPTENVANAWQTMMKYSHW